MSVTELLPALQELGRADKLRVMQFLVRELARDEEGLLMDGDTLPVWSPYDAHEAAETLLTMLAATEDPPCGQR